MFLLSMQCGTTFCRRPPQAALHTQQHIGKDCIWRISQPEETAYVAVGQGWCSCKGEKMKLYREQHTIRCMYKEQLDRYGATGDFELRTAQ